MFQVYKCTSTTLISRHFFFVMQGYTTVNCSLWVIYSPFTPSADVIYLIFLGVCRHGHQICIHYENMVFRAQAACFSRVGESCQHQQAALSFRLPRQVSTAHAQRQPVYVCFEIVTLVNLARAARHCGNAYLSLGVRVSGSFSLPCHFSFFIFLIPNVPL